MKVQQKALIILYFINRSEDHQENKVIRGEVTSICQHGKQYKTRKYVPVLVMVVHGIHPELPKKQNKWNYQETYSRKHTGKR